MRTPSHFLMTLAIKQVRRNKDIEVHGVGALLGSVLPDVPLILLTVGYMIYRNYFPIDEHIFGPTYDNLYFTHPVWVIGHSLFHAPLMILAMGLLGYWGKTNGRWWGLFLFWFALGCGLHSIIDIATHHDDGPLLFFPFDWQTRFSSPVSYWDPAHYGDIFSPFETAFQIIIASWLVIDWGYRRFFKQSQAESLL